MALSSVTNLKSQTINNNNFIDLLIAYLICYRIIFRRKIDHKNRILKTNKKCKFIISTIRKGQ